MLTNQTVAPIETLDRFCQKVSEKLSSEGFDIDLKPGVHLVDDAGADSLLVLYYVLQLQELGLKIDLAAFDTDLLEIDVAYNLWIRNADARVVS